MVTLGWMMKELYPIITFCMMCLCGILAIHESFQKKVDAFKIFTNGIGLGAFGIITVVLIALSQRKP